MGPGSRLGRYELVRRIGTGGMGEVWEAVLHGPQGFRKEVALKLLKGGARDPDLREALVREARLGALLSHPNVVGTLDLGALAGGMYVAMELVRGASVADLARGAPLPGAAVVEVGLQACAGLTHVHALAVGGRTAGLVHRDVKPANLLLDRSGLVKLADLGVSRLAGTPGEASGTPGYMAPEQADGREDARADLFALGATLWRLATGRLPFGTEDRAARIDLALADPGFLLPADAVVPGLGPILARCLRPRPEDRWPDAAALAAALRPLRARAPPGPSLLELLREARPAVRLEPVEPGTPSSRNDESPTLLAPTGDVPSFPDRTVGRATEVRELRERLAAGDRLLTLLGPGGMGKTRLAAEVARAERGRWPGGVWFCGLAEVGTAEAVAGAVAGLLGVVLDATDPAARVERALRGRGGLLLVLDNLEQVAADAAGVVARWLAAAPDLAIVATSRVALGVRGERVVAIDALPAGDAIELFVARAARPPTPAEQRELPALVEALDRMPLAIELAAARTRVMPVARIRERLADRLGLLSGGGADLPSRHRSLRASIAASWELLEPHERAAMAQLTVFADGSTLGGAEAVLDLSAFPVAPWALDVLDRLSSQSLLRFHVEDERFRMLATVRAFAAEQLGPLERTAAEERHAAFHAVLGTDEALALSYEADPPIEHRQDLDVGLERTIAAGGPASRAVLLLHALETVVDRTMPVRRLADLATRVLALDGLVPAERARVLLVRARAGMHGGRTEEGGADFEAALKVDGADGRTLAMAHGGFGLVLRMRGDNARGRAHQHAAIDAAHAAGARVLESAMRTNLANHLMETGQVALAMQSVDHGLAIARAAGNERMEAHALSVRAAIVRDRDPEEAGRCYLRALEVARARRDRRVEGRMLANLGVIHDTLGRTGEARRCFEAALACARETGDPGMEATFLSNLGGLLADVDPEASERCLVQALARYREVGDRRGEGQALSKLGHASLRAHRHAEAHDRFEQALALARSVGDRREEAIDLGSLGNLLRATGDLARARAVHEDALELHRELGNRRSEGVALGDLGRVLEALGRPSEARERYEAALAVHREVGNRRSEGLALAWLGALDLDEGRLEGEARLRDAISAHRQVDDPPSLAVSLCDLAGWLARTGRTDEARAALSDAEPHVRALDERVGWSVARAELAAAEGRSADVRAHLVEADAHAARIPAAARDPRISRRADALRLA